MKKGLKWIGIILGVLALIVVVAIFFLNSSAKNRLDKTYDVKPTALSVPKDSLSIARGKHLVEVMCVECHGPDLGGTAFFSEPSLGTINSANLTRGKGGVAASYKDEDWVRSIRHGINPQGKPLFIMPSKELHNLSANDLGQVIAYLKSLPPMDREWSKPELTTKARVILSLGGFGDIINAETIDHAAGFVPEPVAGPTAAYGEYWVKAMGCRTCHGQDLNGGKDPNPKAPFSPNLTPGGPLGKWTAADFIKTMRTGTTPEGKALKAEFMQWRALGRMTDDELTALYAYLHSVPAKETAAQ
ncbi:MAG: c-type cytochrome [Bacteroidetes bacterium]|nr:c-type cytochrome [Bacteroidota bacterium]